MATQTSEPRECTRDTRLTLYSGAAFGGGLLALGALTDPAITFAGYGLLAGSLAVACAFETIGAA